MDIEIPGAEIVDTDDGIVVLNDPAQIYALAGAATTFNFVAEDLRQEAELLDIDMAFGGERSECSFHTLSVNGKTLVVALPYPEGRMAYLLIREGLPGREWLLSSKLLLLPFEEPAEWGEDEAAFAQRHGRILLFAGLVTLHGWYQGI